MVYDGHADEFVGELTRTGVFVGNENAATRFEEVLLFREKIVAASQGLTPEPLGSEVGQPDKGWWCMTLVRHNLLNYLFAL